MDIDRLINDKDEFRCFEVDNQKISRVGMTKVLASLEGVRINKHPKFYDPEVFCRFSFMGREFMATEPYGDSSVYDVSGPAGSSKELEIIAKHFEASDPIRGGDAGQKVYFLINWVIASWVFIGLLYGAYRGIKWIFS